MRPGRLLHGQKQRRGYRVPAVRAGVDLHERAAGIESGARRLDVVKPVQSVPDSLLRLGVTRRDTVDGDVGRHGARGAQHSCCRCHQGAVVAPVVAVTGGGGDGGAGAGCVVGVVTGAGAGVVVGPGVAVAAPAGAGEEAAAVGAAFAPADVPDAAGAAMADADGCDEVPEVGEVAVPLEPPTVAAALPGATGSDAVLVPDCNALICSSVDEMAAWSRVMLDFSRAVAATMAADCAEVP
jgi:hypothetical protein